MEPGTGQLRKLADLPDGVALAIDAFEVDAEGRLTKIRFCSRVAALDSLAKHLNLLEPLPEPEPPPMNVQVNMGEMHLERLSLEDLQQLRRIMVAAGV